MLQFQPEKMPFHWYKVKNHTSGNIGNFNYRIFPKKDSLLVSHWMGVYCYQKTKDKTETNFPLTEEGLQQAWQWLEQEFGKCNMDDIEKPLTILDQVPYSPSSEEPSEEQAPF